MPRVDGMSSDYHEEFLKDLQITHIKRQGEKFLKLIDQLRTDSIPVCDDPNAPFYAAGTIDRELNIAVERIEEAVMWAIKHVNGT